MRHKYWFCLYQNPRLAKLVVSQPWFVDGLNENEMLIINYWLVYAAGYSSAFQNIVDDIIINQNA